MPIEELVSCGTYNILDVSPLRSLLIIVNDSLLLVYIEFFQILDNCTSCCGGSNRVISKFLTAKMFRQVAAMFIVVFFSFEGNTIVIEVVYLSYLILTSIVYLIMRSRIMVLEIEDISLSMKKNIIKVLDGWIENRHPCSTGYVG